MIKLDDYVLSEIADEDVSEIFDFSFYKFGYKKAVEYLENLEFVFVSLVKTPYLGRNRDEIRIGLFSLPVESHVVFYRIELHKIVVVRVLHKSVDLPNFL